MTECHLCGQEIKGGGMDHSKCDREFWRRRNAGECVKCSLPSSGEVYCDDCDATAKFEGYPGGSA